MSHVGKIVEVEWLDPSGTGGWQMLDEAKQNPLATNLTWGVLIRDDELVQIASSASQAHLVGDVTTIPKMLVKRVRRLDIKKKRDSRPSRKTSTPSRLRVG